MGSWLCAFALCFTISIVKPSINYARADESSEVFVKALDDYFLKYPVTNGQINCPLQKDAQGKEVVPTEEECQAKITNNLKLQLNQAPEVIKRQFDASEVLKKLEDPITSIKALELLKNKRNTLQTSRNQKNSSDIDEAIDLINNLISLHEKLENNQFKQFSLEELSAAKEVYGTQTTISYV